MVIEKKMKIASAAKILKLNKSTAKMIVKKYRETGKVGRKEVEIKENDQAENFKISDDECGGQKPSSSQNSLNMNSGYFFYMVPVPPNVPPNYPLPSTNCLYPY